jgi:uncharacterized protein (TIGR02391 family)
MAKKQPDPPPIEPREFRAPEEIDAAVIKLRRRIEDATGLDIREVVFHHTGKDQVVASDVRETIREIFGSNSTEFHEHSGISIWHTIGLVGLEDSELIRGLENGRSRMVAVLTGLIRRLEEKRADLVAGAAPAPSTYFDRLNLHPRIRDVARDLFLDGHPWDAVFAPSKALLNYVKERSNRHDLDGAPLARAAFSKNDPILAFNDLTDQTDADEQEGMMHLFEGAAQAIKNPGSHSFPEGPEQRAIEYISFLSLLAYRVQGAKIRKKV